MKVTRADCAGSVPWSGVTGKPAGLTGEVATDVSELTARVAALEAALNSLSSASDDSPVTTLHVEWTIDSMEPFQMGYEDLSLPGLQAGTACVVTGESSEAEERELRAASRAATRAVSSDSPATAELSSPAGLPVTPDQGTDPAQSARVTFIAQG